jgi:ATP-dependent Lon protease
MAKTLREALAQRSLDLSHSESLELIAQVLGERNWQTLSAAIDASAGPESSSHAALPAAERRSLPMIPLRDMVAFPEMTIPLFAGRQKTLRAIERAGEGDGRLFLVTQRRAETDAPGTDDLHSMGVLAVILQTVKLSDETVKLIVQCERRARLVSLSDGEILEADVEPLDPARPGEAAAALAREALQRLSVFANYDPASPPIAMARFAAMARSIADPNLPAVLSDLLVPHVARGVDEAQALLETVEPEARLARLIELMSAPAKAA